MVAGLAELLRDPTPDVRIAFDEAVAWSRRLSDAKVDGLQPGCLRERLAQGIGEGLDTLAPECAKAALRNALAVRDEAPTP